MAGKAASGKPLGSLLRFLVKFTVFFVLLLTLLCIAAYFAGSFQEVSDEKQFTLVKLVMAAAVLLGVSSLCGAFLDLGYALLHKKAVPLLGTFGYVLMLLFGVFVAMAAGFILSATGGNK